MGKLSCQFEQSGARGAAKVIDPVSMAAEMSEKCAHHSCCLTVAWNGPFQHVIKYLGNLAVERKVRRVIGVLKNSVSGHMFTLGYLYSRHRDQRGHREKETSCSLELILYYFLGGHLTTVTLPA